jgi:geranylgeranyl diphosphate synthase type II
MADDLNQYLRDLRARVEDRLHAALRLADGGPEQLKEAMAYGLLAPGKRLRPLLVILAAETAGDRNPDPLPAACAVEMIHAYSLIHDDLPAMDDDDLRRGQPTCHRKFGEAVAILAGDALLTLAFEVLTRGYPPATAAGCCREMARGAGAVGMVGGQAEDLAWECRDADPKPARAATMEDLEGIHARKTGALFRACLRLGVWAAQGERPGGPDPALLETLDGYGLCFGQLFQVTDDLLDVEGTSAKTGKRVHKDADRGKLTYPGLLGVEETRRRAADLGRQARARALALGEPGRRLAGLIDLVLGRDR